MARDKAKAKAKAKAKGPEAPPPKAPVIEVTAPNEDAPDLKRQIKDQRARIAAEEAVLAELERALAFKEFPKMVKDRTFASREEQDAAGPGYADQ